MAQIRPYQAQISPQAELPSRNASPADVTGPGVENLGQSINQAGYSAAQAQQMLQRQEDRRATTDMYVALAQLGEKHTKRMPDFQAKADPKNQDLWGTFNTGNTPEGATAPEGTLKGDLEALGARVTNPIAKQRFDVGAVSLTTQFLHQTIAFQGHMAGVYAKQQAIELTDAWQNRVQTDPSQYQAVLAEKDRAIKDHAGVFFQPGMDAGKREQIDRDTTAQITSSMVRGVIAVEPEFAHAKLEAGEWPHLTGEQRQLLTGAASTAISGLKAEKRRVEADLLKQQQAAQDALSGKYTSQIITNHENTGNPQFSIPNIARNIARDAMPDANGNVKLRDQDARALIGFIDGNAQHTTLKNDESASGELLERLHLPWGDTRKITSLRPLIDAATPQRDPTTGRVIGPAKITMARFKALKQEFTDQQTDQGMKIGATRMNYLNINRTSITKANPMLGLMDTDGDVRFGELVEFAKREEGRLQDKNIDPFSLYDKTHPEWLGHKLEKFQKTMQESMRDIRKKLHTRTPEQAPEQVTPPRVKGETIEQYKKRVQK